MSMMLIFYSFLIAVFSMRVGIEPKSGTWDAGRGTRDVGRGTRTWLGRGTWDVGRGTWDEQRGARD
jgi:hypothetical protein